jgi:type IX secretion system PorP/SprF family membrane protein
MKKLVCFFVSILSILVSFGQDASFSQAYANPTYLNPALTGIENNPKLSINYRTQWVGANAKFTTQAATFENRIENRNSAYAVQFIKDTEGNNIIENQALNFYYSYRIKINQDWVLQSGLHAGLGQKSINTNDLIFEDQINDREGVVKESNETIANENIYYSDFSAGLMFLSKKAFFGAAIQHLTQPDISFTNESQRLIRSKISLNFGAKISVNDLKRSQAHYSPNIIIQRQGKNNNILIGNYLKYNSVTIGGWYRLQNDIILSFGIDLENLRFAYSSDISVSDKGGKFAHEISIVYLMKRKKASRKMNPKEKVFCPKF